MILHLEDLRSKKVNHFSTITNVTLQAPHDGEFKGTATCAPEDENFEADYFGEILANHRAAIKYFKYKRKQGKTCVAVLQETYDILKDMNANNKVALSKIRRQMYDYNNFIKECDYNIEIAETTIKKNIATRDKLLKMGKTNKENH